MLQAPHNYDRNPPAQCSKNSQKKLFDTLSAVTSKGCKLDLRLHQKEMISLSTRDNVTTLNSKLMCLIKDSVPEYLATVPHAAAKARLAAALCSVWTAGNNTLSRVALWGLISTPTCCASMLMNFATPTLQQCSYIVQVRRLWSIRPE